MDDDRGSCLLLRKMITSLGYSCEFVHNVADGLRAAASKHYCLVLIDSFLPDQNGLVACHAIKMLPREGPNPVIIGIMSCRNEHLQRQCLSAGMAGVLVKPFYKTDVADRIRQTLSYLQSASKSCTVTCHQARGYCNTKPDNNPVPLLSQRRSNAEAKPLHLSNMIFQEEDHVHALTLGELNSSK